MSESLTASSTATAATKAPSKITFSGWFAVAVAATKTAAFAATEFVRAAASATVMFACGRPFDGTATGDNGNVGPVAVG